MKSIENVRFIALLTVGISLFIWTPPAPAADGVKRYWAVFVGISNYMTVSDLSYPAADASSVRDLLLQDPRWIQSNTKLLQNSQATRSAVESAILSMAAASDEDDVCLFYFSGHGGQASSDFPPIDESDGKDEYLACWDSNNSDYSGDYVDDDLADALSAISGTIVVILDSCNSGGQFAAAGESEGAIKTQKAVKIKFINKPFESSTGVTKLGDGLASDLLARNLVVKDLSTRSDTLVLTASAENETSAETSQFLHGEFTYFLLSGLKFNDSNNNGHVSGEEAFDYLNAAYTEYKMNTVTPQKHDTTTGEVDLVRPTAERLLFIGYGDFYWVYPFNTYYRKRRAEYIYNHALFGGAGDIIGLKIYVEEIPPLPLQNCTIRMTHSTSDSYSSPPQWTSADWATVYSGTKTISSAGPVAFELSTPFHYDGIRNLIIDFSFSNDTYSQGGTYWGSYADDYTMIHYSDDYNYGEPTDWSGTSPPPTREEDPKGAILDLELEFGADAGSRNPAVPLLLLGD